MNPQVERGGWLARLRQQHMHDYNRPATLYWLLLTVFGWAVIAASVRHVLEQPAAAAAQILAASVIAAVVAFFPIKLPASKNSIAAGDIFLFLVLLLHGPLAAVFASAAEATVASWRSSRRLTSRLISPASAALAMLACGSAFAVSAAAIERAGYGGDASVLALMLLLAVAYFFVNSGLSTSLIYLKRAAWPSFGEWLKNFGWLGLAYMASASIAALMFMTFEKFGVATLIVAVPIIAMFLTTMHYYFREREIDEQVQRERLESAQREAQQAARHFAELEASERRFASAFNHASIGMAMVETNGRILQANGALTVLLGCDEAALLGRSFSEFVVAEDQRMLALQLARIAAGTARTFSLELRCRRQDDAEVWVALSCGQFADASSNTPCLIFQTQDITARRHAESRLQHIAWHDSLTHLANRSRFNELLQQAIDRSCLRPDYRFAVLFLDFDRFKLINDSLGHRAGDEFLVRVAARISESVRPGDVVARLGGDEFAVLTGALESPQQAVALAERLQAVLRRPLLVGRNELTTSASIGITFSGHGYSRPDEMLRDADIAMYKAKAAGKAQYALFDAGLHAQVTEQLHLENDLRRAIEQGGLTLVYQPLTELDEAAPVAIEALVRWQHSRRGALAPSEFIAIAEESGLILPLTQFVLDTACRQLARWKRDFPQHAGLSMHVNISGADLASPDFAGRVMRTIGDAGLSPSDLTLEITESMLMERLDAALATLGELSRLGVRLSIDDFGTGYSSLAYLSRLPFDSLKIDRSFVAELDGGRSGAEIVRAVVTLGASLGKTVIAEGIETDSQLQALRRLGCRVGQGFFLAMPQDPLELSRLLADRQPPSAGRSEESRLKLAWSAA
jgi:diguanylate cyclase (GGDEF)-like protein/PAS domain S-box-containing protein